MNWTRAFYNDNRLNFPWNQVLHDLHLSKAKLSQRWHIVYVNYQVNVVIYKENHVHAKARNHFKRWFEWTVFFFYQFWRSQEAISRNFSVLRKERRPAKIAVPSTLEIFHEGNNPKVLLRLIPFHYLSELKTMKMWLKTRKWSPDHGHIPQRFMLHVTIHDVYIT